MSASGPALGIKADSRGYGPCSACNAHPSPPHCIHSDLPVPPGLCAASQGAALLQVVCPEQGIQHAQGILQDIGPAILGAMVRPIPRSQ